MAQPKPVSSPGNPTIKAVRALAHKKRRRETGRFAAPGVRMLREAVACGHALETLVVHPDTRAGGDGRVLLDACAAAGGEVVEADEHVLAKLTGRDNPPGAVGVLPQPWRRFRDLPRHGSRAFVVLDGLRDPGNVGAIVRSAEAAGAAGVVVLGETCDPFAPESVRASTGAVFAQPLVRAGWQAFLRWRRKQGGRLVATAGGAATDFRAARYPRPTFLLMGDEHAGVPPAHAAQCDEAVAIPMRGRTESVNVTVAAALVLYEIDRQHHGAEVAA